MEAQVLNSEPKEISLSVTETDVGILYIIQHELLLDTDVGFAGVIVKHPLTNECWMRISSKTKPLDGIKKAADSAMAKADGFKKLFNSTIQVQGN